MQKKIITLHVIWKTTRLPVKKIQLLNSPELPNEFDEYFFRSETEVMFVVLLHVDQTRNLKAREKKSS